MRKVSSFEKKLCLGFVRKTCKVESVEHLMVENKSQWAFDFKVESAEKFSDSDYKKSLLQYQRDGLKTIARNLNDLN